MILEIISKGNFLLKFPFVNQLNFSLRIRYLNIYLLILLIKNEKIDILDWNNNKPNFGIDRIGLVLNDN